jgi:hypothetical protein
MSLHPRGHVAAAQLEPTIHRLIAVHALALACVPLLFLGAWGLSGRMAWHRFGLAGLVLYTFGLLAIMNAAVADGLVAPNLFRQTVASAGSQPAIDAWRMMSRYNFFVNQAYAQVFTVASALAIVLWSVSAWRSRGLSRGLGIYGFLLGLVTMVALFSGHLHLDAHGFGMVVFGQAAWFIAAGIMLWQVRSQAAVSAA